MIFIGKNIMITDDFFMMLIKHFFISPERRSEQLEKEIVDELYHKANRLAMSSLYQKMTDKSLPLEEREKAKTEYFKCKDSLNESYYS